MIFKQLRAEESNNSSLGEFINNNNNSTSTPDRTSTPEVVKVPLKSALKKKSAFGGWIFCVLVVFVLSCFVIVFFLICMKNKSVHRVYDGVLSSKQFLLKTRDLRRRFPTRHRLDPRKLSSTKTTTTTTIWRTIASLSTLREPRR